MSHATTMRGGAIVLIVLLMLALSMFGVLSMVSANSDLNMARKNAEWVQAYYALDSDGQYRVQQARVMARQAGFETLATAGWTLDGNLASLNLTDGVQNLRIVLSADAENTLSILSWQQWQEPFDYEYDDGGFFIQ